MSFQLTVTAALNRQGQKTLTRTCADGTVHNDILPAAAGGPA